MIAYLAFVALAFLSRPALAFASRVRPSTPPLSQRVDRHCLLAHSFGCSTDGIQTCPHTSQQQARIVFQPIAALYIMPIAHNAIDFESAPVYNMSCGHYAERT